MSVQRDGLPGRDRKGPRDAEFVFEDDGQAAAVLLINAAMLRITRRRAHPKIWIDDALGGAPPCRRSALRQRGEVTFDAIPEYAVGLHADRVARVIRLRPNRRGHKNRRGYQNRPNRCAHHVPRYNVAQSTSMTSEQSEFGI
jgi:hypothetical protein